MNEVDQPQHAHGTVSRPRRRTVAAGLAWAVPTIAVGAAAPAMAASTCPPLSTAAAAWTTTISTPDCTAGVIPAAPASWTIAPGSFTLFTDSRCTTPASSAARVTTRSSALSVVAGQSYTFTFVVQSAQGYMSVGGCQTENSNVFITVGPAGSAVGAVTRVNAFTGYTTPGSSPGAGAVLVEPPSSCTDNGPRSSVFGHNATAGSSLTASFVYVAPTTGTVDLVLDFQMAPSIQGNNDDWRIVPTLACL